VLKKRRRSIAAVANIYHKQTHTFVIEVPKSWEKCVRLDKENGNTLWQDAIRKEMKNVQISFQILNVEEAVPPNYQAIWFHMICDVKNHLYTTCHDLRKCFVKRVGHKCISCGCSE
jgi:hypothetical protein